MIVQEDTVFVSGMDPDANEEDIAEHFGAIGLIKVVTLEIVFVLYICGLHSVLEFIMFKANFDTPLNE